MDQKEYHVAKTAGKEKEKWYEHIIKEEQETPKRLENAAKAISGIISITLTLLLSAFEKESDILTFAHYTSIVILWLLSVIIAFFVIFPFPYRYSKISINSYIKMLKKVVLIKYSLLLISTLLYLTGMILLIVDVL